MDDAPPKVLRRFDNVGDAVEWVGKWVRDRGGKPWCNFGYHEHMQHKYLMIYPAAPEVNPHPRWTWPGLEHEYDEYFDD